MLSVVEVEWYGMPFCFGPWPGSAECAARKAAGGSVRVMLVVGWVGVGLGGVKVRMLRHSM